MIRPLADPLRAFSSREVMQPTRTVVSVGPAQAFVGVMPAYVPGREALDTGLGTTWSF